MRLQENIIGVLECDEKGNIFCDLKQCVIATWQSILWFQAIHVEVFQDFNQYVNATW